MKKFSYKIEERLTARHLKCLQFSGDLKNKQILDIGPSFGWFEKMAIESGCFSVLGIEPDKNNFFRAMETIRGANFKIGSALDIPSEDNIFDLVVMFDVIEHLPKNSESKALKEIIRVLKPGGHLVLSTPYSYWLSNFMDPAWYFGHRHYSERNLIKLLQEQKFEILANEIRGGYYEIYSAVLMYLFKWTLNLEIPFKSWFEGKKRKEYLGNKKGYATIFIRGSKPILSKVIP